MKSLRILWKYLRQIGPLILMLIALNWANQRFFYRIDLTAEKRYTLSKTSEQLAGNLPHLVYFKVYLEGSFPAGFKRLQKATQELLDEYKVYANGNIDYEFIDPFDGLDKKGQIDVIQQFEKLGIQPTSVEENNEDGQTSKLVVPGMKVIVNGGELEFGVNLLRQQFGQDPEVVLNQSIELLEYEISNALRKCQVTERKKIAFTDDHGELDRYYTADFTRELNDFYETERISLSAIPPDELQKFAAIIIARPDTTFSEFDKFKIDQFVMHGGKLILAFDAVDADLDSLMGKGEFFALDRNLNLDDMIFQYGVRINHNMLNDLQCNGIPLVVNVPGGGTKKVMKPWIFYPVVQSDVNHPVTRNLQPVWLQFPGTLDTTGRKEVKKTVLLQSSAQSKTMAAPVMININRAVSRYDDVNYFNEPSKPVAVLLEGKFESVFKYRVVNQEKADSLRFVDHIDSNKMLIISDGDILANDVRKSSGEIYPLGYDKASGYTFGNAKFMLNCVDYLLDDSGLLEVRSKEFKIRTLDKARVKKERFKWQIINIGLPLIIVWGFGWINRRWRRWRYEK